MAYRRRHGLSRQSTFTDETHSDHNDSGTYNNHSLFPSSPSSPKSPSLAAQAIRASAAYSQSSLSSAYDRDGSKVSDVNDELSKGKQSRSNNYWGIVAQKAKSILDEDDSVKSEQSEPPARSRWQMEDTSSTGDLVVRTQLGDNKADIIQEARKMQNHRANPETQLKASRDVAMATAAKAKLLLRELKTVKADLAFAKLRCSQLEEENKMLRENREKGGNAADDDLIRLQLEALLAEKARLAHENEVHARENRFLREIVEFHQLQDVVYIDEGIGEEAEEYPYSSASTILPGSPPSLEEDLLTMNTMQPSPASANPEEEEADSGSQVTESSNTSAAKVVEKNVGKILSAATA